MASSRPLGHSILASVTSSVPRFCFLLARSSCTAKVTSPFFLLVYVDDVIVASSSNQDVDALLLDLQNDFVLKELGPLHFFLGVQVTPISDGLLLSQESTRMTFFTELVC
jgi:hypothetical protein